MTEQEINEFFPPEFIGSNGARGLEVFFDLTTELKRTYGPDRFEFTERNQQLSQAALVGITKLLLLQSPEGILGITLDCRNKAIWEMITNQTLFSNRQPYLRYSRVMSVYSDWQDDIQVSTISLRTNYGLHRRVMTEFIARGIDYTVEIGLLSTGSTMKVVGVRLNFPVR